MTAAASEGAGFDDEPLRLPTAPPAPARPPLPILTALVPVGGALVLWQVTGAVHALWFAALGPVVAVAAFVDGARTARRTRRRSRDDARRARVRLEGELARRHEVERSAAWRRFPDVAVLCRDDAEVWRVVPGRDEVLVVGRGHGSSGVRLDGDAADDDARALRRRARRLDDVPVTVPLGAGVAVRGPAVLAAAVARALVMQLCLVHPPGRLYLADPDAARAVLGALPSVPHEHATAGAALVIGDGGGAVPSGADIPIVVLGDDAPPPPRCAAVLTMVGDGEAILDHEGSTRTVRVEALSLGQAAAIAAALSRRAAELGHRHDTAPAIDEFASGPAGAGLSAVVGTSGGQIVTLDLVADGPHAVVVGMTGTGKSELLITWAAGICRGRSVDEVCLLLVDFKGGRSFDALAALPHVTGVVTDLDEHAAMRAVQSLRAEIRRRERVLASCGARDVEESGGALGRFVVIVDEYAALVTAHPDLHELFADVAARGRALGIHLILASQRAHGAFRDGVLANAGLRIALRTLDGADSRAVLGVDDAVRLSGRAEARGTALVRRATDADPQRVRVARSPAGALGAIGDAAGPARATPPWLPPLPRAIDLDRIAVAGRVTVGLSDEPEHQRQAPVLLPAGAPGLAVVGAAGSGRSSLLQTVARQLPRSAIWVPADPEAAWDALATATAGVEGEGIAEGAAVIVDDVDALLARYPAEYAAEVVGRIERLIRAAGGDGGLVALSAARCAGPAGRLLELLPHRALLSLPTRADHVAAGGDGADHVRDLPPGRGRWGRLLVQFALSGPPRSSEAGEPRAGEPGAGGPAAPERTAPSVPEWAPSGSGVVGFAVAPGTDREGLHGVCAARGLRVVSVAEAAASPSSDGRALVEGSPEEWLAQWRLLTEMRRRHELVVGAECAAEFRALTGRRELPPYAAPRAGRAWRLRPDGAAERVRMPSE